MGDELRRVRFVFKKKRTKICNSATLQLRLRGSLFDIFSVTLQALAARQATAKPAGPRLSERGTKGYSELTSWTGSQTRPLLPVDVGPNSLCLHRDMEAVYTRGIWMAESLQLRTMSQEKMWLVVTHIGDPKAAFLLVFPFTYFISKRAGVSVLWVAAVSEWLNLVFKWMLFGERPFWWIGESRLFVNKQPRVHQFSSTCETGPGSPSGHAMVTAAVWWVVVSTLGSFLYSRTRSMVLSATPYLLYVLMLVAVGVSRIFILAHFPHQVIAGSITGFILGVVLSRRVPEGRPLLFFFSVSFGLLFGTLMLHAGLQWVGVDLSWSIALAKKWCSRAEWIRLDTAPFSSLTRDCGALLGLGLAQYWKPGGWSLPWAPRALSLAISSMGLYHVNRLPLPVRPQGLFYGLFFVKFVIVPQIVMVLVPGLVHLFTHKKKKD